MSAEVRELIRRMASDNGWGAPRIHGELRMLGFDVSERTVSRYLRRLHLRPDASQKWLAFLRNHREMIAAMQTRLSAVDRRVSALPAEKRMRVIDYATWGSAQGRGSSWDEMLRRAGLVDGVGELGSDEWGQVPLSREKLLQLDPDILVLPGWVYANPGGASAFFTQITHDPSLKGLRSVRTGRVYQMPERLKSTTSQYFAEAVEWLARTAYPEIFQ